MAVSGQIGPKSVLLLSTAKAKREILVSAMNQNKYTVFFITYV
jgi:hypothetical protein